MAETVIDRDIKGRAHTGDEARVIVEKVRLAAAGSPFVSLRTVLLFSVTIACAAAAPMPFGVIGAVAGCLLAFQIARTRSG